MTTDFVTTQLLGCQSLARPDGRVALRLDTDRLGAIAFEVDRERIAILRKALSEIEQFLNGTEGGA
jgi:hypothetical protein